jgi:hypothetical protein
MGHFWYALAAGVFIGGIYNAVWAIWRRWGPWATMPTDASRASRPIKWFTGVLMWSAVCGVLAGALYHVMAAYDWARLAGFMGGTIAGSAIITPRRQHF